jgi:predicted ArsR family transcriptional regulator
VQPTRWAILNLLKERGQATVEELAEALGLAPITVRHHLAILEKDNLIASSTERGGVGRPYYIYQLTSEAEELFPKRYHLLAERLLAELKDMADGAQLQGALERIAKDIAGRFPAGEFEAKSIPEKLNVLVDLLAEEGFLVRWHRVGDEYVLKEYSCPYYYVSQRHPEVCHLDLHLISSLLNANVERRTCMVHGDEACTYRIIPS